MPEVISLGPLSISGLVLSAALSGAAGLLILYAWVKQAAAIRSGPWLELTAVAVPIVVMCWKFGILWRDPSLLWERPGLVLMMTGGGVEAAAGCVLSLIYWFMAARKRKLSLWLAADALAVACAGGIGVWCLLSAPAYRWGYAIVCAAVLIRLFRQRAGEREASGGTAIAFCYGIGAGTLAVSLFLPPPPFAPPIEWLGLPERQWLMIGAGLLGVLLQVGKERTG
jgi:hypothetical protein